MKKDDFAFKDIGKDSKILEIGPLCSPLYPKSEGFNVKIVDCLTREELREAYRDNIECNIDDIEEVDFVASKHYASSIGKKGWYDVIAASHVIEHVVDLIEFINDCSTLLKTDGIIKLIVPDKRYDFDFFREVTSIRTVIDNHVYRTGMNNHSIGTMIDNMLTEVTIRENDVYIPNSAIYFARDMQFGWNRNNNWINDIFSGIKEYSDEKYSSMHSWIFTPKSFEILIYQLNILGYIDFKIKELFVVKNSMEFYVTLERRREEFDGKYLAELYIQYKKEITESFSNYEDLMQAAVSKKRLYIYGTGIASDRVVRFLELLKITYQGHVVSDGYKDKEECHCHKIYELSELLKEENICVLIGVSVQFRDEICKKLAEYHIDYIF